MCIIQSNDLFKVFVSFSQLTTVEQAWVAMCEVKRWLEHLRKFHLTSPLCNLLFLFLMPGRFPFHLHSFFTSHLQRVWQASFPLFALQPVIKSLPNILCHSTHEKIENKEAIWLRQWGQKFNRNPSLLTQVSEFLQADHTGEQMILCQSKF